MTDADRLDKLERELRATRRKLRWLLIGTGLIVGAVALGGVAAAPSGAAEGDEPSVVRADKIVVEDGDGTARAVLGVVDEHPGLMLNDPTGGTRVILVAGQGASQLTFFDGEGTARAAVGTAGDHPSLILRDADATPRAGLVAGPDKGVVWTKPPAPIPAAQEDR